MVHGPEVIAVDLAWIVTDAVVVADLVAELVAHGVVQREDAVAAAQTVGLPAIAVHARGMVNDRRLRELRLLLADHAGAGDTPVGQVDAGAEGGFGRVFAHVAAVHPAFTRTGGVVDHAAADHHPIQLNVLVLADHQARNRHGLEIFRRRLSRSIKHPVCIAHGWFGEHPDAD